MDLNARIYRYLQFTSTRQFTCSELFNLVSDSLITEPLLFTCNAVSVSELNGSVVGYHFNRVTNASD